MEVLVSFVANMHLATLVHERAAFVKPRVANFLQGKYRSFHAVVNKSRVRWLDQLKLLELYLTSSSIDDMARITDKIVDGIRGQYAMDFYQEIVAPMYASQI